MIIVAPRVRSTVAWPVPSLAPASLAPEDIRENNLAAFKLVHQMALVLVSRQRRTTSRLVELMRAAESGLKDRIAPLVDQSSVAE